MLFRSLPYDKNLRRRPGDIDVFVEHGYVVIMQDTRGRFASDGDEYYPLAWEAQDGYDSVEWAAALSYADGKVGTMGQSYLGATQYLLAPTRPPHLRASFPASAPADFHQCWVYHSGGAFELGWQIPYAILMARDTLARKGLAQTLLPELERELAPAVTPWAPPLSAKAYRRLPLMAWAKLLGYRDAFSPLKANEQEEKAADAKLSRLAEFTVNQQACDAGEFGQPRQQIGRAHV